VLLVGSGGGTSVSTNGGWLVAGGVGATALAALREPLLLAVVRHM
jgi:hypothetical protein